MMVDTRNLRKSWKSMQIIYMAMEKLKRHVHRVHPVYYP